MNLYMLMVNFVGILCSIICWEFYWKLFKVSSPPLLFIGICTRPHWHNHFCYMGLSLSMVRFKSMLCSLMCALMFRYLCILFRWSVKIRFESDMHLCCCMWHLLCALFCKALFSNFQICISTQVWYFHCSQFPKPP